jgi:hypothetical protein
MSEPRTPAGGAPPAETVEEHVKQTGEEKNLGAGNEEPDPATADAPRVTSRWATRREKLTEQGRLLTGDSVRSRSSRCSPGRKPDLRSGIPGWSPMRACGTAWSRRLSSGVCGHRTGGGWPPHRTIGPSGSGTPNPVLRASSSSTPGGRKPGVVTGQPADRLRFARWGQPDLGCRIENRMQNRESYGQRPPPPLPTIERR